MSLNHQKQNNLLWLKNPLNVLLLLVIITNLLIVKSLVDINLSISESIFELRSDLNYNSSKVVDEISALRDVLSEVNFP